MQMPVSAVHPPAHPLALSLAEEQAAGRAGGSPGGIGGNGSGSGIGGRLPPIVLTDVRAHPGAVRAMRNSGHSSPCWGTLRWDAHLTQLRKRRGKSSVPPAGGSAFWLVLPAHDACSSFFHASSPIFIDASFSPHWGWEGWPPTPPSSASLGSWVQPGAPRPADARVLSLPGTQRFGSGTTLAPRKDERHRLAPGGRCCRTACEQPPRPAPLFAVPTPPPPLLRASAAVGMGEREKRMAFGVSGRPIQASNSSFHCSSEAL